MAQIVAIYMLLICLIGFWKADLITEQWLRSYDRMFPKIRFPPDDSRDTLSFWIYWTFRAGSLLLAVFIVYIAVTKTGRDIKDKPDQNSHPDKVPTNESPAHRVRL